MLNNPGTAKVEHLPPDTYMEDGESRSLLAVEQAHNQPVASKQYPHCSYGR